VRRVASAADVLHGAKQVLTVTGCCTGCCRTGGALLLARSGAASRVSDRENDFILGPEAKETAGRKKRGIT
jgi:hypothetical protein